MSVSRWLAGGDWGVTHFYDELEWDRCMGFSAVFGRWNGTSVGYGSGWAGSILGCWDGMGWDGMDTRSVFRSQNCLPFYGNLSTLYYCLLCVCFFGSSVPQGKRMMKGEVDD